MQNFSGSASLTNVTFSGNSAVHYGGGLVNSSGDPILTNVTFYGNSAEQGAGMWNSNSEPVLTHVTFYNNSASSVGGGIYSESGSVSTLRNTILWGNFAPVGGQIHNVASSAAVSDSVVQDGYAGGTNIITADPLLGTPGSYGGFTDTIPLLSGSSAIDSASSASCPVTDQRGVTRPQGIYCDIGAYEYETLLSSGVTVRASVGSNTAQRNQWSGHPSISGDGRYVVFNSPSTNLVEGDTNFVLPAAAQIGGDQGYFDIDSNPSGASVVFDGSYKGTTPVTVAVYTTADADHTLRLTLSGYQPWEQSISQNPGVGETISINADLVYIPVTQPTTLIGGGKGYYYISSVPSGASVYFGQRLPGHQPGDSRGIERRDPGPCHPGHGTGLPGVGRIVSGQPGRGPDHYRECLPDRRSPSMGAYPSTRTPRGPQPSLMAAVHSSLPAPSTTSSPGATPSS